MRKYRELLQAKHEMRPAAGQEEESGTYFLVVQPDGTQVYGYAPGAWVPSVFGEWSRATGPAPSTDTYWSQVASLTHEARRAVS